MDRREAVSEIMTSRKEGVPKLRTSRLKEVGRVERLDRAGSRMKLGAAWFEEIATQKVT